MPIPLTKNQIELLRWVEGAGIANDAAHKQRASDLAEFSQQMQKYFLLEAEVATGKFKLSEDGTSFIREGETDAILEPIDKHEER